MRTHRLPPARPGVAEFQELGWAESTVRAHLKTAIGAYPCSAAALPVGSPPEEE